MTPWFGAIMHYRMFEWWDTLINGQIHAFKPDPKIVNLNPYIKPVFIETNGELNVNLNVGGATI